MAAQLVTELSADRFSFRHALTRQAVYGAMLARERRTIHQAIGEAIERVHGDRLAGHMPELAYHFHAAEAWEKTLQFAPEAGRRALSFYSPRAAVQHFTWALDAAQHLSRAPGWSLYRDRGLAYATLGEFERARADLETSLQQTRLAGDRLAEWKVLGDLGGLWAGYDYAEAGVHFEQALALAALIDDQEIRARSLLQLGNWQVNVERVAEAEQSLTAALAIFEESGNQQGMAESLDMLGIVANTVGDIPQTRDHLKRAIALYRSSDNRRGLASTLATYAFVPGGAFFDVAATPPGFAPSLALELLQESLAISRDIGWRSGEAYSHLAVSFFFERRGVLGGAFDAVARALQIAQEIEHREWLTLCHGTCGVLYLHVLDGEPARQSLAQAYELACQSGSLHFMNTMAGLLATACIACDDLEAAAVVLDALNPSLPMQTIGQRRVWFARVEYELARGQAESALEISDRLFATALDLSDQGDIPHAAKLRGESLLALGRMDEAEVALSAARAGAEAREIRPLLWRAHLSLGRLHEAMGRHADAWERFQSARSLVQELAGALPDGPLRDNFLSRATAMIPTMLSRGNDLTAREREVALLVGQQLSNRDIADVLFVGERTVETHVANILRKLDFKSRTQIAAWTVEAGLADTAS